MELTAKAETHVILPNIHASLKIKNDYLPWIISGLIFHLEFYSLENLVYLLRFSTNERKL